MAKQEINIGSSPNDGTGDTARSAFSKAKLNFTELYGFWTAPPPGITYAYGEEPIYTSENGAKWKIQISNSGEVGIVSVSGPPP